MKRLTLSQTDKQFAGVCGGIAEFFGIDSTLVRALFVLATLMGGPGLLLYILLWLVIPKIDVEMSGEKPKRY